MAYTFIYYCAKSIIAYTIYAWSTHFFVYFKACNEK